MGKRAGNTPAWLRFAAQLSLACRPLSPARALRPTHARPDESAPVHHTTPRALTGRQQQQQQQADNSLKNMMRLLALMALALLAAPAFAWQSGRATWFDVGAVRRRPAWRLAALLAALLAHWCPRTNTLMLQVYNNDLTTCVGGG